MISKSKETRQDLPLAICLVSGGLDSCVTAAIAMQSCRAAFLHVNYGQRTEKRELKAFNAIADYYGVRKRLVADISYLKAIGGSALTDSKIAVPEDSLGRPGIPITYVPFRNSHILAIATSWGEVIGARYIYIGAIELDSSGYPDCRKSYFAAYNRLIKEGTRPDTEIEIVTPLIDYDKGMVVKKGLELNAPLYLTWSCYQNQDVACGRCESCLLRLRGFAAAGVKDPIPYEG
jgi:7-cyano-7-deazaguanine synthase